MRAQISTDHKTEYFEEGLQRLGYKTTLGDIHEPEKNDVLIVWNRKSSNIDKIKRFEKAGSRVIVSENGYIGTDENGARLICLALSHHLGKGRWFIGKAPRHHNHHFKIKPWRKNGEEIVILAQRGIGESTDLMWAELLCEKLIKQTKRSIRIRPHPGKDPPALEPDLDRAYAVITYASAAAIKAIAYGVPAFYLMPEWVGKQGAVFGTDIEKPFKGDRTPMFHTVGWAQWTPDEVWTGKAFKGLLAI